MKKPKKPFGAQQWKEAVELADFYLRLESARLYGLIETDIRPDVHRCEYILREGARRGIFPDPDKARAASLVVQPS
jgi:hypothetical protein